MTIAAAAPSNTFPFAAPRVDGYPTYLPLQPQPIGSLLNADEYKQNRNSPKLFEEIEIRGVKFPNKAWVAPMCQYSADNGHPTDHHFVHYGSMAMRGWGSIMVEATGYVPEGRITPECAGIWDDSHIPSYKRIVDYVHGLKGVIGIQLAHAGRKGSTPAPFVEGQFVEKGWKGGSTVPEENGGWPTNVPGPSALSFKDGDYPDPIEASVEYLDSLKKAFVDAIERCEKIGFDFIEIHGAHGYFIHEFTDPISNKRTDTYGGSFENRIRLPLELAKIAREKWQKPLFYRVSASDWLEEDLGPEKRANATEGEDEWAWWGIEQTTLLTQRLADLGVDLIDVSSGGNDLRQKIKLGPGYQLHFADHLKKHTKNILVGAVGLITTPHQANDIIEEGKADVVLFARQVLRDIDFPLEAALELGVAASPAVQYQHAWTRMVVKRDAEEIHHKTSKDHGIDAVQGQEGHKKEAHANGKGHAARTAPPEVHTSVP
ncbi:hypothetical protein IAU59_006522 [Kwoniella sp. CBS 9459]